MLVHSGSVFFERLHLLMGFDQTDHLLGFEFQRQVESKFVDVERSDAKEPFVASRDSVLISSLAFSSHVSTVFSTAWSLARKIVTNLIICRLEEDLVLHGSSRIVLNICMMHMYYYARSAEVYNATKTCSVNRTLLVVFCRGHTLIHVAACTYWHLTLGQIREQNFCPTIALLEGAQGALPRLKSFVFCSTTYVQPYHKLDSSLPQGPCEPVAKGSQYFSTYGECKAETEHAIEQWVENNNHK
jgi:hypothetical protein